MRVDTWIHLFHILSALVWVGDGVMHLLVGARARPSTDPTAIPAFARIVQDVGFRALTPAVIVVLLTGIWLVLDSASWHFSHRNASATDRRRPTPRAALLERLPLPIASDHGE